MSSEGGQLEIVVETLEEASEREPVNSEDEEPIPKQRKDLVKEKWKRNLLTRLKTKSKIIQDKRNWGMDYTLGIRHNFCFQGLLLNPRPVLGSSAQTTRGMLLVFFCKTSKWPCLTSHCIGGIFQVF